MKHFSFTKSLLVLLLLACFGYSGSGQIPDAFTFQILLTDNSGNPVPDGSYNVSVSFYNVPSGGTALLAFDQETVIVTNGIANIMLGGQSGIGLPFDEQYFIGLTIDGETEMTPRLPLNPSAYSLAARAVYGSSNIFQGDGNVEVNGNATFNGDTKLNGKVSIEFGFVNEDGDVEAWDLDLVVRDSTGNLGVVSSGIIKEKIQEVSVVKTDSLEVNGLAIFNGGLQVGSDLSYFYVDSTGKVNITGDGGTAAMFDPNGPFFFYSDVSFRGNTFLGGSDSYSIFNNDGTGGTVNNGEYVNFSDNLGNSFQNGTAAFGGGVGVGHEEGPNIRIYPDGIKIRDVSDDVIELLTSGLINAGSLNVTGEKNFRIDHPLDPENKYLLHRSIESSDRMNLYNGNVTLNKKGEAEVELPAWFGELNEDYRYQLTAMGAPGPNLYIAQKIKNNKFKISGGVADMEVSWQVTGNRKDKYANGTPALVEVLKEMPQLSAKIKK